MRPTLSRASRGLEMQKLLFIGVWTLRHAGCNSISGSHVTGKFTDLARQQ
jgi:hypothetical protein